MLLFYYTKRQEILDMRQSQKKKINTLIKKMRKQLADHSSGEVVLDLKEKEKIESRLDLYVAKLDSIRDTMDDEVR